MMRKIQPLAALCAALFGAATLSAQDFRIGPEGYFRNEGVDVMAFYDFYPEGHQVGGSSHYLFLELDRRKLLGL